MLHSPWVVDKRHSAKAGSRADSCYLESGHRHPRLSLVVLVASPGPSLARRVGALDRAIE
jgi:hypothetical protein